MSFVLKTIVSGGLLGAILWLITGRLMTNYSKLYSAAMRIWDDILGSGNYYLVAMVCSVAVAGLLVTTGLVLFLYRYALLVPIRALRSSYCIIDDELEICSQGMFGKNVEALPLSRIRSVMLSTKRFTSPLFGYGTVTVWLYGVNEGFELPNAPGAEQLYEYLRDKAEDNHRRWQQ